MLTESQKITATDLGFKTNKSKFDAIFQGMTIATENIWNTIDDAISNVTLSINQLAQNADNKSRSLQNLYNKDNLFSTVNKLQDDIINNVLQRIISIKDEINKETSGDKNAQYLLDLNSELVNLESESGNIVKQMADQMKEWISNGIATKNWETNFMWKLPLDELNKKFQDIAIKIKLFEMSTGILEISKDSKKEDISTVINNILNMGKFQPSMATGISALEDVKATYKIFKDPYEALYQSQKATLLRQIENNDKASNEYSVAFKQLYSLEMEHVIKAQEIVKAANDTRFSKMQYIAFKDIGTSEIAYAKEMLHITQLKTANIPKDTIEWYDAQVDIIQKQRDLATKITTIIDATASGIQSSIKDSYDLKNSTLSQRTSYISNLTKLYNKKEAAQLYGNTPGVDYTKVIADIDKEIEIMKMFNKSSDALRQIDYTKKHLFSSPENIQKDNYANIDSRMQQAYLDFQNISFSLISGTNLEITMAAEKAKETWISIVNEGITVISGMAEQLNSWLKEGAITKADLNIIDWNAPLVEINDKFQQIALQVRKQEFTGKSFDIFKGFTNDTSIGGLTANNQVSNILNQLLDLGVSKSGNNLSTGGIAVKGILDTINSGTDPFQAWYNFSMESIQNKIANAEDGSTEYFAAFNELMQLLTEKTDHAKQAADKAMTGVEELLGKIEETMKLRIAEERKSVRGDAYFIDVGSTRNSEKMLQELLDKVKTGDPKAMQLIEDFKKKMLGISR